MYYETFLFILSGKVLSTGLLSASFISKLTRVPLICYLIKRANIDGSSDSQGSSMKIQKGSKNRSNVLSNFIHFTLYYNLNEP